MSELIRCKDCGKPITKDNQENFFSLCYECYRKFKSSQMRKGYCSRCFGCISLLFIFSIILLAGSMYYRDLKVGGKTVFILVSVIAVIIPFFCIYSGYKQEKEWENRKIPIKN